MTYQLARLSGDSLAVPQLVLNQLQRGDENLIRTALYILSTRSTDPADIARALRLKSTAAAQRALDFWYGAGLLERTPETAEPVEVRPPRLTTAEVAAASCTDPQIAALMHECQNLFGGVVTQTDTNILVSLYCSDGIPVETILLAAAHAAAEGHRSGKYVERMVLRWREAGIVTGADAERYLHQLEIRRQREQQVAELLGRANSTFPTAERRIIAGWFEEFGYDTAMIAEAVLYAGEQNTVRYVNGILKNWYGKGWRTVRDVQAAAAVSGSNVQNTAPAAPVSVSGAGSERIARRKPLKFMVEEE